MSNTNNVCIALNMSLQRKSRLQRKEVADAYEWHQLPSACPNAITCL